MLKTFSAAAQKLFFLFRAKFHDYRLTTVNLHQCNLHKPPLYRSDVSQIHVLKTESPSLISNEIVLFYIVFHTETS